MSNRMGPVILLLVLIALVSLPFWYGAVRGKGAEAPRFEVPGGEKQCVEPTAYMKSDHMKLLDRWKEEVVRKGQRTHAAADGNTYTMSLTDTCIRCHSNKEKFCDRCHDYAGVAPKCWNCHVYKSEGAK